MVPRRLAEFSAGRHAARAALAELGHAPVAIPQGADRAPVWPKGVAGSISHSRSACLAIASVTQRGLGLDLEPDEPLSEDLWAAILLPDERRRAMVSADPGRAAMLMFSAKEAAYKAQYPLTRQLFGFETLEIVAEGDQFRHFRAVFHEAVGPFALGEAISGRFAHAEGHVLTLAWI